MRSLVQRDLQVQNITQRKLHGHGGIKSRLFLHEKYLRHYLFLEKTKSKNSERGFIVEEIEGNCPERVPRVRERSLNRKFGMELYG